MPSTVCRELRQYSSRTLKSVISINSTPSWVWHHYAQHSCFSASYDWLVNAIGSSNLVYSICRWLPLLAASPDGYSSSSSLAGCCSGSKPLPLTGAPAASQSAHSVEYRPSHYINELTHSWKHINDHHYENISALRKYFCTPLQPLYPRTKVLVSSPTT